jgi:hypothetical protein
VVQDGFDPQIRARWVHAASDVHDGFDPKIRARWVHAATIDVQDVSKQGNDGNTTSWNTTVLYTKGKYGTRWVHAETSSVHDGAALNIDANNTSWNTHRFRHHFS